MAIAEDPAIFRRKLKGELRTARATADMTRESVVAALDWSLSKLVRIETGEQGISVTDLQALLQLYQVTDENAVRELTELARASRGQTWWGGYRDVISKGYGQLLAYEGSSSEIRTFHPLTFPGLLHTDDYALALLRVHMSEERARRIVDLRMERQERLFEQLKPPQTTFLVGEEALYRWIGSPAVMRRQLRHSLELSARSSVSIRLVPFAAGAHPGLIGPFILLTLQDSSDELLFLEGAGGDLLSRDDEEMIMPFIEHFEALRAMSLSEEDTRTVISQRIDAFSDAEHTAHTRPTSSEEEVDR